ncbi:endonuclease/exonuclease/phosphatase family protein [Pseudovibrio sp. JE062]|uniref:endonuclease/exonuclease/phosphatase family protein n=1 Tax=Pseudovibrio sp. JE062 TaxID=439495 RepID=UPI000186BB4B|nr:endonuclease/exonuclease/phosphatase family protein [Pseudovibrio sp. JE062]EEA96378.1 endonuclease/exonuclease/phosphatase family protein [Pseudovibrio sp. JE062]
MKSLLLGATILGLATPAAYAQDKPVTVVSYNVQNLFDTIDDENNPQDDTYLSKEEKEARGKEHEEACESYNEKGSHYYKQCIELNWGEESYSKKLMTLGEVIRSFPETPDILVLPETENKQVLDDLVNKALSGLDYKSVVQLDTSNNEHNRGIDVGIISRLPLKGEPETITVFGEGDENTHDCKPTRDIVKAEFEMPDGESMYVFGVHFPSGAAYQCRKDAMEVLNKERAKLPEDANVVAAGDFNFNCTDVQNGEFQALAREGHWSYPPEIVGCAAPGSAFYYRDQSWSFLDMILVSSALRPDQDSNSTWFADLGSFHTVVTHPSQYAQDARNKVRPKRFDADNNQGASDHWPVLMRFLRRF